MKKLKIEQKIQSGRVSTYDTRNALKNTKRLKLLIFTQMMKYHKKRNFNYDIFNQICNNCIIIAKLHNKRIEEFTNEDYKLYKTILIDRLKDAYGNT